MLTLVLMFICRLLQSRWEPGQLQSCGFSPGLVLVKMIAAFITHVQYLTEKLLSSIHRGKFQ